MFIRLDFIGPFFVAAWLVGAFFTLMIGGGIFWAAGAGLPKTWGDHSHRNGGRQVPCAMAGVFLADQSPAYDWAPVTARQNQDHR